MISADEARRISGKAESAKQEVLNFVEKRIKWGAEQGAISVFIPFNYGRNPTAFEEAIAELRLLGYGLTREKMNERDYVRVWF